MVIVEGNGLMYDPVLICLHSILCKDFLERCQDSSCRVIATVLYCSFKVSEFKFQSLYYVHFLTNTLRKGMNILISPAAMG